MKPHKQTVYLPKATFPLSMKGEVGQLFSLQQGYLFTSEELNEYTKNVIKQALETAAEKSKTEVISDYHVIVNKQSITNTFQKIFKKFEI